MSLSTYRKKRDFHKTPEPAGAVGRKRRRTLRYFVQRHAASRLHYDFRLELDGVLKSWAVPKGPSLDPRDKRLAMHVEDHPLDYGTFEGVIPKGEYGAGTVLLWDRGVWRPTGNTAADPLAAYAKGHLDFLLDGDKLHGRYALVRIKGKAAGTGAGKGDPWLLIKAADDAATKADITAERPESVADAPPALDLPLFVPPQLCTPVQAPPDGAGWLHEIKLDGYRMQARIQGGKAQLLSRTGQDWTGRFPTIAKALVALPVQQALIDGEVVSLDARGVSRFQALVNAIGGPGEQDLTYTAFDLLHLDGADLRDQPLLERKAQLRPLLPDTRTLRYLDHVQGPAEGFFDGACAAGLEGVVAKRASSTYRSGRTRDWVKVKCHQSEDLVIVGWTEPQGSRTGLGALLLGAKKGEELRYAGKVGTGFSEESLVDLTRRLRAIEREAPPVTRAPRLRGVHWAEPLLVAEVRFTEWTADGVLRHPVFLGLREDVPASAAAPPALPITVTNADRVVFPGAGLTKGDLVAYYHAVADRMLPGLVGRPLSLVRCPKGVGGQCFFHRHPSPAFGKAVREVPVGDETYVTIDGVDGLLALAQAGVIEIHPWGSRTDQLDRPDIIVMDLDPDPKVPWTDVVSAAVAIRDLFAGLGLVSFARVTGGKGVHVVAPIVARQPWEVVKPFCRDVAELLARADPERFTANARKDQRTGRIFIDYLRNGLGATAIASWSARARPDATVAVPVGWDELADLGRSDAFHVGDVLRRRSTDPWEGFATLRQSLTQRAITRLKR